MFPLKNARAEFELFAVEGAVEALLIKVYNSSNQAPSNDSWNVIVNR